MLSWAGASLRAGAIVGISVAGITGIAVTTGTAVLTETAVAVYAGLGRVMEPHRFSCVDVGAGKNAALAGEAAKEKRITPMQATSMTSNRTEVKQERLVEEDVMALHWERQSARYFHFWQNRECPASRLPPPFP